MHNRELFEKLGERLAVEDLLLVSTLFNQQQQDPNALTNILNVVLISKFIGSRSGLEGALLASMLLNANTQQASSTGTQPALQANLLPLLLLMGIGREERDEESEGYRERWRRDERDKDSDNPRAN